MPSIQAAALHAFLALVITAESRGQAWVPEKGQLSISTFYEYSDVGNHLFSGDVVDETGTNHGKSVEFGDIKTHSGFLSLEYGVSNRLALTMSMPVVVSKYDGLLPDNPAVDDGVYRGGFQDFRLGIRYMHLLPQGVVTPSLAIQIPSRNYETLGHVAVGRNLKEVSLGVHLGKLLDFASDNLYAQAGYNFSYTEKHDDLRANRSNAALTLGYFLGYFVSLTADLTYQKTHGGIDWLEDTHTLEGFHSHDRFAKSSFIHLGGTLSWEVSDAFSFYFGYTRSLWGENTHEIQFLSFGSSLNLWLVE